MKACELTGIEIKFHKEGKETVATLKMYPNVATVKVPRLSEAKDFMDKIYYKCFDLIKYKDIQF